MFDDAQQDLGDDLGEDLGQDLAVASKGWTDPVPGGKRGRELIGNWWLVVVRKLKAQE